MHVMLEDRVVRINRCAAGRAAAALEAALPSQEWFDHVVPKHHQGCHRSQAVGTAS